MKKWFLLLIVSMVVQSMCSETKNALLVWTRDGETVGYDLGMRPQVKMTADDILLTAGNVIVNYPLRDYVRMVFGNWNFDSIEEMTVPKALFSIEGDKMVASGLKPGECINVYSVGGILLWNGKASDDGILTIPMDGQGIHVVKVGDINFKINKLW